MTGQIRFWPEVTAGQVAADVQAMADALKANGVEGPYTLITTPSIDCAGNYAHDMRNRHERRAQRARTRKRGI